MTTRWLCIFEKNEYARTEVYTVKKEFESRILDLLGKGYTVKQYNPSCAFGCPTYYATKEE